MTMRDVKGVAPSEETTENYRPTLLFLPARCSGYTARNFAVLIHTHRFHGVSRRSRLIFSAKTDSALPAHHQVVDKQSYWLAGEHSGAFRS